MKLRFIVVSSVNWVHYAHFLCRYSNLNRMFNFLRALNSWLLMSSFPVSSSSSLLRALHRFLALLVVKQQQTRPSCRAAVVWHRRWLVFACVCRFRLRARSVFDIYSQVHLKALFSVFVFLSFPFTNLKNDGGEVIMGSAVTPCFPQATASAFPLPLSDWEIRSNCQHGS